MPTRSLFLNVGANTFRLALATSGSSIAPGAPTALTPDGGPVLQITAHWTQGTGGTPDSYTTEVSLTSDFAVVAGTATVAYPATSAVVSGLQPLTLYYVRTRARNGAGVSAWSATTSATSGQIVVIPGINLLTDMVATVNAKATANTAQWQAFKFQLDKYLNYNFPNAGSYQGSDFPIGLNYAMGYRAMLNAGNTATAYDYADKAISILLELTNTSWKIFTAGMFVGYCDGTTTTFALPTDKAPVTNYRGVGNAGSAMTLATNPYTDTAYVRSAAATDVIGSYHGYLAVGNTLGASDYVQGVDFDRSDLIEANLQWKPGKGPSVGSTYYLRWYNYSAPTGAGNAPTGWTYDATSHSVTFAVAPAAGRVVTTNYTYGTRAVDFSTLSHQQTYSYQGGLWSIMSVDNGYTTRYIAHCCLAVDWLWDYPGFSDALKTQIVTYLTRIANQIVNGTLYSYPVATNWGSASGPWPVAAHTFGNYNYPILTSNYGDGGYLAVAFVAFLLSTADRDPTTGATLAARVFHSTTGHRANYLIPTVFDAPSLAKGITSTYVDGFWSEGYNYANQSAVGLMLVAKEALNQDMIDDATPEYAWASKFITSMVGAQPTATTMTDLGDGYVYPMVLPDSSTTGIFAEVASDATVAGWAAYLANQVPANPTDWADIAFRDPTATGTSSWRTTRPLQELQRGTGLTNLRADWNYTGVFAEFLCGNLVAADHQNETQTHFQLQRGADDLVVNPLGVTLKHDGNYDASVAGGSFRSAAHFKASFANLVYINDGGKIGNTGVAGDLADRQIYFKYPPTSNGASQAAGVWYGSPGCHTEMVATPDYAYMMGDARASWSGNGTTTGPLKIGGGGPATEYQRSVLYVRPGLVLIFDRVGTFRDTTAKQLRWWLPVTSFSTTGDHSGATWAYTVGGSTLSSVVFSPSTINVTGDFYSVHGGTTRTLGRVLVDPASNTTSIRYLTAMQALASSDTPVTVTELTTSTTNFYGCVAGNVVALFGLGVSTTTGSPTFSLPITYAVATTGVTTYTHYIGDVIPGHSYTVTVDGVPQTVVASTPTTSLPDLAVSAGLLVFTTTGTGSSQTVSIS